MESDQLHVPAFFQLPFSNVTSMATGQAKNRHVDHLKGCHFLVVTRGIHFSLFSSSTGHGDDTFSRCNWSVFARVTKLCVKDGVCESCVRKRACDNLCVKESV